MHQTQAIYKPNTSQPIIL